MQTASPTVTLEMKFLLIILTTLPYLNSLMMPYSGCSGLFQGPSVAVSEP
jgi:hypothetical protein